MSFDFSVEYFPLVHDVSIDINVIKEKFFIILQISKNSLFYLNLFFSVFRINKNIYKKNHIFK